MGGAGELNRRHANRSRLPSKFNSQISLVMWEPMGIEDPRGRALADRHYSRQTIGAKGYAPPGKRFALHYRDVGEAVWVVVLNRDITGSWRWRNTLFRNETQTRSSALIIAATSATYQRWLQRYGELPPLELTTEIDIEATRARRSSSSSPGHCYLMAGWRKIRDVPKGHGRSAKVVLAAPPPPKGTPFVTLPNDVGSCP